MLVFFDVYKADKQKHLPETIAAAEPHLSAENFLPMLHKTNLALLQTCSSHNDYIINAFHN